MISPEDGKKLLQLAKKSIISCFDDKDCAPDKMLESKFSEPCGCFVTIHEKSELKGCIGFPEPVMPLYKAIIEAARAAAFDDPRFPPLSKAELKDIQLEISLLTKPELLKVQKPEDYLNAIKVGKDGLIIRGIYGSGLLLPQVAAEWGWNTKDFLEHTCMKAGLNKDAWKDLNNRIYVFQAQIFSEEAYNTDDK